MAKNFKDLTEREILALGVTLEEENGHRRSLIETFRERFGEHIPLIRKQDVKGFIHHTPVWLVRPLGVDTVRRQAEVMELESRRFYERAIEKATDASVRKLL